MVSCWFWIPIIFIIHGFFHPDRSSNQAIFGIYRQKNFLFYLKFLLIYSAIKLRKYFNRAKKNSKTVGYGVKLKEKDEEIDCVQNLPADCPKAVDAVYFVGASRDETYLVAAIARRQQGIVNSFWHLRIPKLGLLEAPQLPDTTLKADEDDAYAAGGLKIQPVKPMRVWKITYDGPMRLHNKEVAVKFDLTWKSELPYFDFDTDVPAATIARAIALQPWSRSFFQRLKTNHQTHHEQMGFLTGQIEVENHGQFNVRLDCMRDHSIAPKRDWKLMHRYGLHSVHMEDGTKFCVGIISHPDIFSSFEMGYLYTPDGRLVGVDSCDLELWRHGEGGTPPTDYAFNFRADGRNYRVECEVIESPEVFLEADWDARVIERMCRYQVNGKAAWGFAEWEYRHHGGRPLQK